MNNDGDGEIIYRVIQLYLKELIKVNYVIYKNIQNLRMDFTEMYNCAPGYDINIYTGDFKTKIDIIDIKTRRVLHDNEYSISDFVKMENRTKNLKILLD